MSLNLLPCSSSCKIKTENTKILPDRYQATSSQLMFGCDLPESHPGVLSLMMFVHRTVDLPSLGYPAADYELGATVRLSVINSLSTVAYFARLLKIFIPLT